MASRWPYTSDSRAAAQGTVGSPGLTDTGWDQGPAGGKPSRNEVEHGKPLASPS